MELSGRERVLLALSHKVPDRVPIAFGGGGSTAMLMPAYENLKRYLGLRSPARYFSYTYQYALIDEQVLEHFCSDVRPLVSPSGARVPKHDADGTFTDRWGITWRRPSEGYYYDMVRHPLAEICTSQELDSYDWPRSRSEELVDLAGLVDQGRALRRAGRYAIIGAGAFGSIFDMAMI